LGKGNWEGKGDETGGEGGVPLNTTTPLESGMYEHSMYSTLHRQQQNMHVAAAVRSDEI